MTIGKRRHWPRVVAATLSVFALVGIGTAGVAGAFYNQLSEQITTQDVSEEVGHEAVKPKAGEPINILLVGSDTRENGNGHGTTSRIAGARSDTTIILHISGDRTRATGISIPRDMLVDIPVCKQKGGGYTSPHEAKFNEAFYIGGVACTIKTIEQFSGLRMNHFVVVDFKGFIGAVNAMGGVEVCMREAVEDSKSNLNLPAGKSVVKGEQALAFVRARYSLGDGGDLGRIERQQAFLGSAVRKATSLGVIANPTTLYAMLSEVTKSITTDPGLGSLDAMTDLAINSSAIKPSEVSFVTVPNIDNNDGSSYSMDLIRAAELWRAVKLDQPWPTRTEPAPESSIPADQVTVDIVNSTGTSGIGGLVSDELSKAGFKIGTLTTGSSTASKTSITHLAGNEDAARTLQAKIGKSELVSRTRGRTNRVTLILGKGYDGPGSVGSGDVVKQLPKTAADPVCS